MPNGKRAPSSQFYWRDWLADPAVRAMSRDERGGYADVLAFTHQTDSPGVMTEDQVRGWAGYSSAEWVEHRERFAACFRIRKLDSVWLQKRTVEDHLQQARRYKSASTGGSLGGLARKQALTPARRSEIARMGALSLHRKRTGQASCLSPASASASASVDSTPVHNPTNQPLQASTPGVSPAMRPPATNGTDPVTARPPHHAMADYVSDHPTKSEQLDRLDAWCREHGYESPPVPEDLP